MSKTRFYQPLTKIKIRDPSTFPQLFAYQRWQQPFCGELWLYPTHQPRRNSYTRKLVQCLTALKSLPLSLLCDGRHSYTREFVWTRCRGYDCWCFISCLSRVAAINPRCNSRVGIFNIATLIINSLDFGCRFFFGCKSC